MQAYELVKNDYYLIWDADTIPLKSITFFNQKGQVLLQTSKENHEPYFKTLSKLLKIKKEVPYSFITEHMMIEKKLMNSFISEIQTMALGTPWPIFILMNIGIEDLPKSGFSEYESFGNYIALNHKNSFQIRQPNNCLNTYRYGSRIFGNKPTQTALKIFKDLQYDYVTFEEWDIMNEKIIKKNNNLSANIVRFNFIPFYKKIVLEIIKKQIR